MGEARVAPKIKERALRQSSLTDLRHEYIRKVKATFLFPPGLDEMAEEIVDGHLTAMQAELNRLELWARRQGSETVTISHVWPQAEEAEAEEAGADAPNSENTPVTRRKRR